ncbi:hypothetical protein ABK040_012517 [Willaertia magna]
MSDLSQVNLTQILIDNPSLFSCETFPLINDFYIWTSPFNSTEDKLYGVSDGSKLLCEQSQQQLDESCQFFSNFSSNEMQFFFPHFEHLVLYNYSNYDLNNWDEIYALNDLFISFFTCFYCTNETSTFKTKIYPEFVAQSNYKEVKNSQWIFKGEPYTLPFYSYTKFISFCNSVKDVNNNDKYVYARDSCNDGKTTIFEISSSKALMSVEFVFFSLQCFITFAIVTVPIFYGWIKRWNFNRMDINKTIKVWRNVTDMRMTATTFLQLSTIFMVIITAKQIYDSPYVYFFDDYNLTLLLGAFEMCVMANIPILAMFIDTLRRTEKNERETSIGFTITLFIICIILLSLIILSCIICIVFYHLYHDLSIISEYSLIFRPVFFIFSIFFVGILLFGLVIYSCRIYFQLKKNRDINFFQFRFSRYLILFIFVFLMDVTAVMFEILWIIYSSLPTLELDLLRFRLDTYFIGIFNWCILYMLFNMKGLNCYFEMIIYFIIEPFHLQQTYIGKKIINFISE